MILTESKCQSDFAILSCTNGDRLGGEPDHDEPKYHPKIKQKDLPSVYLPPNCQGQRQKY